MNSQVYDPADKAIVTPIYRLKTNTPFTFERHGANLDFDSYRIVEDVRGGGNSGKKSRRYRASG